MTLREVAQYLNCHATTLHRLLDRREIPAFRLGDHWRFRRYDIEEWIRHLKSEDAGEHKSKRIGRPPKYGQ